jgi:hypothetical protein
LVLFCFYSITKESKAKNEIESGKRGGMFEWRGMKKVNMGGMRGQNKTLGNDFDKLTLN